MKVTFLGTGSSSGTPGVCHGWGHCNPANPKNRRLRPSILVEEGEVRVLFDTSPDLREQCLRSGLDRLDAVVYTHAHADHLHGIDDLRAINRLMEAPIPAYGDTRTLDVVARRFGYVFEPLAAEATFYYKPTLIRNDLADGDRFEICGVPVSCFEQDHGYSVSMGYRIGDLGFCTDAVRLPEHGFGVLQGVSTLIVGVLTETPHETHAHVDLALDWINRLQPKQAFLTHLGVNLDHDSLESQLPRSVRVAYDGLAVEV